MKHGLLLRKPRARPLHHNGSLYLYIANVLKRTVFQTFYKIFAADKTSEKLLNETINYNENFDWRWEQGRFGFGIFGMNDFGFCWFIFTLRPKFVEVWFNCHFRAHLWRFIVKTVSKLQTFEMYFSINRLVLVWLFIVLYTVLIYQK